MAVTMKPVEIVKAVAAAGTAERLVASKTLVKSCVLRAAKVGGANTGNVHIGLSTVLSATRQIIELKPGDVWPIPIPAGQEINLMDLYIDAANSADGVTGLAWR